MVVYIVVYNNTLHFYKAFQEKRSCLLQTGLFCSTSEWDALLNEEKMKMTLLNERNTAQTVLDLPDLTQWRFLCLFLHLAQTWNNLVLVIHI